MRGRWGGPSHVLVGLILLLLSTGCTKQVRLTEEVVKKDASLEELLTLYGLRRGEAPPFKGLMEVTSNSRRQGRHTFQATFLSQGGQIRIRGFNLLGGTLFDLRLIGPFLSLTIPSERMRFEGSRNELEEMIQTEVPLGSTDLIHWVSRGGVPEVVPPFIPGLEKGDDFFILYLFTLDQGKALLQEKIWIERTAFWVKKVEMFDPTGARRAVVTLDDYRKVGQHHFPFAVKGESRGERVALNFREVTLVQSRPPKEGGQGGEKIE